MPDPTALDFDPAEFKKMECFKLFKTPNQLVVEMTFDPSSKLLALGTSDNHIKVFDVHRGFQTHNFIGHRGLILKL
jgi:WD40 repeat protein